jgi:hypothetical protein
MKRTTVWLPDDLRDRLHAESDHSGVPVAELIRRRLDAQTPPLGITMGELVKVVDKTGMLKVLVLDAREGQLLVEPDDYEGKIQIWVANNLVTFPEESTASTGRTQ